MAEIIHIASATDNNYVQHLGVMLTSLFVNNPTSKIFVHVLYEKLQKNNIRKIIKIVKTHSGQVEFAKVNISKISKCLIINGHVTKAAYFKILIPELINKRIKKVLYLDCDLVILGEIKKLWNTDISKYYVGAASDPSSGRNRNLGIPKYLGYFNTGVVLINISRWKQTKTTRQVLNFIKKNPEKIVLWDQDALNAILYNKWLKIDPKYNCQTAMYGTSFLGKNKYAKVIHNPTIVHYSSSSKPWQFRNNHPLRGEYWKYLSLTDWRNYQPRDLTLKSVLLHFMPLKLELLLGKIVNFLNRFKKTLLLSQNF